MSKTTNHISSVLDITFVGSGISTSFTLIPLLESLKESGYQKPLKITIIEKSDEFHTGLAYGPRSGGSALLITSLEDFLPKGTERDSFINWLSTHKSELLKDFEKSGGELSKNWIKTHKQDIEANKWEEIYIPRRFFGKYIKEKVASTVKSYNTNHNLELNYVTSEVIDIERINENYHLTLENNSKKLITKHVVISVGIPPVKQLWNKETEDLNKDRAFLISDPYKPSLRENLKALQTFVNTKNKTSDVLIIGANASAMEMIYKLNDISTLKEKINEIYVISPIGSLPNSAKDSETRLKKFVPQHLLDLQQKDTLTALEIYEAASKDLDVADRQHFGTAVTEVPVSNAFIALLSKLNTHELKEFACHYGNEIGKRQRRAGGHYTKVVDKLKSEKRLHNISGYFESIYKKSNPNGVKIHYKTKGSEELKISKKTFQVVINCMGSKTLKDSSVSVLIDNLMNKDLCKPNDSYRGFIVNSKFEAKNNLYIIGPLLAGNLIDGVPLWHIEHCGRIISLGKLLSKQLIKTLK